MLSLLLATTNEGAVPAESARWLSRRANQVEMATDGERRPSVTVTFVDAARERRGVATLVDALDFTEAADADRQQGRQRRESIQPQLGAEPQARLERRVGELIFDVVVEQRARSPVTDGYLRQEAELVRIRRGA